MRYLIVDGMLSGTGIRDSVDGGYLKPTELGLSSDIILKLKEWLLRYENEHYMGFKDEQVITDLDNEGKEIAVSIRNELVDVKVEYFSDAKMIKLII